MTIFLFPLSFTYGGFFIVDVVILGLEPGATNMFSH